MDEQKPDDENLVAMLCHLSSFSAYVTGFGMFLGPLIVWLVKKDDSDFIDYHGKEAMNFNITIIIGLIISGILMFFCIGVFVMPVVLAVHIIFTILASIAAKNGERYAYPFSIRFIK